MTTISKIPIRTVFDANNSPLGLSEFQTGEVVSIEHGGTGANTTANARFNLSVDNVNVRALISVTGAGTYDNTSGVITIQTAAVTSVGGQTGAVSNAQLACSIISSGVLTTGNVGEVTNLYFTNTRAVGALSGGTGINIDANGLITSFVVGGVTSVGGATGAVSNAQLASSITSSGLLTTSNVSEGTNQYFTNARVQTYLQTVGNIYPSGNNIQDLGRPTNRFKDLYLSGNSIYLGTVVLSSSDDGKFAVNSSGTTLNVATSSDLTTANVTEVNNLYYTNARVYANVTALNYATTSYVANEIANLVNSAPSTLDTLNELASALNNDPSFATTTATLIGNSYNQANAAFAAANTKVSTVAGVTSTTISNSVIASGISQTGILTTANVTEVSNLYYTNARVYANVESIGYASNSYVNTRLLSKANVADLTTSNVLEGSSLYFSNARARAAISVTGAASYDNTTGVINVTGGVTSVGGATGAVSNAQLASSITSSGLLTTANVSEVNNLYFTNARSRSSLSGGTGVYYNENAGTFSIGQHVGTNNNVTFANVVVTGNLLVQGNAINFESNTLTVQDPLIQVGINPVGDSLDLGFFGHYIGGSPSIGRHAGLFRDATDGQFKLFTNLDPEPNTVVDTANASYQSANLVVNFVVGKVTDISNHSTTNLSEGSNLYFTNARVYANVESIGYASNSYVNTRLSTKANVADLTTSNVSEGSNLYFTNTRSRAAISVTGAATYDNSTGVINVTGGVTSVGGATGAVSNAQLASSITSSGLLTTSNVSEGTNLYFSNARVYANVQSIGYASNSYVNSRFLTADGIKTLTNTTFDVSVSSNNIFSILGNQISSYTGSGSTVVLSQSPTISVLNISDSQMNLDGGSGIYYWAGQSGVAQTGDLKAGVYASDPSSNNSLFTFGTNGSNYMSVGVEGSLFVGTARPSNNGGLNTTYPGWLVVQSGGKFGGTINTLGALQFDDANTGKIIFADGTEQNTAFKTSVLTTANVSEVTNLYFTNARVYSNVVALNYATTSHVASEIANLVNSAPSTLDTLNELASALNNDPSFATTTATLIGNSYNQANAAFAAANTKVSTVAGLSSTTISNAALASGITSSGLLTTANVSEVTNLYFTNTRSIGALTGGSGVSIAANGLITSSVVGGVTSVGGATGAVSNAQILAAVQDTGYLTSANITEITNLYFTNTRAISALTEGSGINIDANGLITATVSAGVVNSFNTISVVNGAEGNIIASGSDTLKIETTGLITANTNPSTKTLSFTIGGNFPFFDSTGSQNNIALRVADSTVQSSVSFIYLPFSKSDGTSVNTLRYQ